MTATRFALLLGLAASGCATTSDGVFPLRTPASALPESGRMRYLDGQVSLNDACAIKLTNPLSPRVRPLYVNGAPIGFC